MLPVPTERRDVCNRAQRLLIGLKHQLLRSHVVAVGDAGWGDVDTQIFESVSVGVDSLDVPMAALSNDIRVASTIGSGKLSFNS